MRHIAIMDLEVTILHYVVYRNCIFTKYFSVLSVRSAYVSP